MVAAVVGRVSVPRAIMKAVGTRASAPRRRVPRTPPTAKDVEAERPFWGRHPNADIAEIEDEFYRVGFNFLAGLLGAALGKAPPRKLQKAGFSSDGGAAIPGWGKVADLFKKDLSPDLLMDGWTRVIDQLVKRLLPGTTVTQASQALAIRSHLLYKAGLRVAGKLPDPSIGWLNAKDQVSAASAASMEWTRTRAVEHMTALGAQARHNLMTCLLTSKEAGDGSGKLQQRLFDGFSQMNRDWRRVALTEAASASCNGALGSVDPEEGWEAIWTSHPNACKWCRGFAAKRYKLVAADAPNKNGDTQVWPGKSNIGRSAYAWSQKEKRFRTKAEIWWPTIPAHPNCGCVYTMRKIRAASPQPKAA
jgi:hypothetical protein